MASKLKSFVDGIECVHSEGREHFAVGLFDGSTDVVVVVAVDGWLWGGEGGESDNVDFCVTLNICGFALLQQFDDDDDDVDVADSGPFPPSAALGVYATGWKVEVHPDGQCMWLNGAG